jgi:hypothetical protein
MKHITTITFHTFSSTPTSAMAPLAYALPAVHKRLFCVAASCRRCILKYWFVRLKKIITFAS